jgi:glycosyltransferase involved in cell wall biosynthesis
MGPTGRTSPDPPPPTPEAKRAKTLRSSPGAVPFLSETVVLIPALNEVRCIRETVEQWLRLGAARVRVVDNGSSDETARTALGAGAEVVEEPRRGYGAAAWRGLQEWPERLPWVLFSSADGSDRLSAEEAAAWQAAVADGADLIVGDRVTLSESRVHLKPTQRFGNWVTCRAIGIGWGRRFNDMGSLRLARHGPLVALGMCDRGFGWNVEMQVKAIECGWMIVELPIHYFPRTVGESKISGSVAGTIRAGAGIVRMLAWLWRLHRVRRGCPRDARGAMP